MESVIKSYIDCFGNSNLAICVVEAVMGSNNRADDFIFRYENDAMLKLTGVLREQIDNVNFSKSVFSDNKALLDILNTNIAENRNVIILEYSLRTDKYFNLQSYHIKDNLYGSIIADVSSHARTQIALTSTVNTFEGGLCLIKRDENGNMNKTYVSDGFCRMLGTSRDSIMNRCREDVFAGVYPDDKYKVRSLCDEHAADNEKFSASFRMHTASGEYIWVFANASVKTSGNGFIYYVTYTDITEQKKEETSAREREAMFGLALGNSDLSVWKYNFFENKLSFISLNDTAKTKIDGNELENFPQCILDAEDVREDSISVFTDMIERVKNGEDGVTGEVWFADKKLGGWWCEKIT